MIITPSVVFVGVVLFVLIITALIFVSNRLANKNGD
jgi:hypothetical protein